MTIDSLTALPDSQLIQSILAGDPSSFSPLIDRYERAVKATCLAILKDSHLAQDASQDSFLLAYRQLPTLKDHSSFGPWLLTIARHRSLRLLKQRRPLRLLPVDQAAASSDLPDDSLLSALARLPAHERAVISLRYFEHHDVRTIAALTGRPIGTITKQLTRAHDRLRQLLKGTHP